MGAVLGVLFSPLTLLITKYGAGYLLFTLFLIPLILGLLIISIMVKMIYVFCFYFPNYLLFGFNSSTFQNESFLNVPSVWYHFLIVSIVIWIFMFMITVIRFTTKGNSNESNEIIKSAFFMAMKGVGLLFIINGLIFVLNFIILSITSLLVSGDTSFENMFVLLFLKSFLENTNFNDPSKEDAIFKAISNANITGIGEAFSIGVYSNLYDNSGGIIGLMVFIVLCVVLLIIIAKIIFGVVFDIISKLFQMMILFVSFPVIVPWSIGDGGKKLKIWKDEYLSALLSLSAYLIGLKLISLFINIGNSFIDSLDNSKRYTKFFPLIYQVSGLITVFIKMIFMVGSIGAYKGISALFIKYIGTELNTNNKGAGLLKHSKSAGRVGFEYADAKNSLLKEKGVKHISQLGASDRKRVRLDAVKDVSKGILRGIVGMKK
ncbi:hypothetical protein NW731_03855 [Mycoplasmopsis felis]|uniref:Mbov_0396 family ICE element transmembrane protein n=1 Tax=Mycoplasmopsis felis TaxID=33923 RepID=UPI0021E0263B|nr:hypothetical protein [Mycoplasmopsis felis]MCU9937567.1 hypothetical protein [Mycoplasmopsis felis]